MKYTSKKLLGSIIDLNVTFTTEEFSPLYNQHFEDAIKEVELKGFRKGQAPREMAEKYLDKEKVFEAAAHQLIRSSLDSISEENDWTIIDSPKIELLEPAALGKNGFGYNAKIVVFPEVKIGNYKKLAQKIFSKKSEDIVSDADIQGALEWLQNSRAKTKSVSRPAHIGDQVEMHLQAYLDGNPTPVTDVPKWKYQLAKDQFIPGFSEKIENHNIGEDLTFSLTIPKDFSKEDWQGKDMSFKVHILNIFEREVPEINDDFAKSLGATFSNLESLKTNIREGLQLEKNKKDEERRRLEFLKELAEKSEFDIPQNMIDKTIEQIAADRKKTVDQIKTDKAEFEKIETRANQNIKNSLLLYEIAKLESLNPSEQEIQDELNKFPSDGQIDEGQRYNYIYDIVKNKKVFEFLENLK